MTRIELIELGKHKVRRDERLMLFYLQEFEKIFKRKPVCAGCSFDRDWNAFISKNNSKFTKTHFNMKNTFKLKNSEINKIHSYRDVRVNRCYGYKMSNDFAINYLTKGTDKEIEERKAKFEKLPDLKKVFDLETATKKEIDSYAESQGIDLSEFKKVSEKREFLKSLI